MISIRKANERGTANFGWLHSKHTFSFGHYHDPLHMGFSALRVINDDLVSPAAGFETHGHRDMEIISYVQEGQIEHKDSEGNIEVLPAGEFQLMSAGRGIYHSEYNASNEQPLKFLQIWIQPNALGGEPRYQQKDFGQAYGLTPIISPDGVNGTLKIKQNASLSQLRLKPNQSFAFKSEQSKIYIHLVSGSLAVLDETLNAGDGAKIADINELNITSVNEDTTALIFELP